MSGFTPTGEATAGRPQARYCTSLKPHLPRDHGSSTSGMTPMSKPAMSAASRPSTHGRSSHGNGHARSPGVDADQHDAGAAAGADAGQRAARSRRAPTAVDGDPIQPMTGGPPAAGGTTG